MTPDTVRGHLEAIRDDHWEDPDSASESGMHGTLCGECDNEWPCHETEHAVAALDLLNAARVQQDPPAFYKADPGPHFRLVPDPRLAAEPGDAT